jgi:uncharacterized protein (TIGR02680 family)
MHTNGQPLSLPRPQRERWQPLRSGFLNIYRFDDEEFHYENGRLLLRGNNGTGKTRVLALQLPFLLDGEVISQRLEPDADPAKRVEWNLLMGRYPDRTGYTWIEFGRQDRSGNEYYITLGCGLSANEDQSGVRKWFFITGQRIGIDLGLATETKQVVGKDRLRERIGGSGEVFEDVGAYRRAVNDALYRLDDYRYASLMNLLIQLRRPQLTRRLDENELSGALSEALPPVSPAIIASLAEAFRDLESDRSNLQSFTAALTGVERFLSVYRRYAEVAAKRRADRVRAAHYEYEAGMKEILTSEAECDRSLAELARLNAEIQRISGEQQALQAEIAALERRPEMKDADTLDSAFREAKEKRKEAESAAAELADAIQARKARSEEHIRIKTILERCELRLKAATDAAVELSRSAVLESLHRETIESLDILDSADDRLNQARRRIESAVQVQIEKIDHVRKLNQRIAHARNEGEQAAARRDQLSGLVDDAGERLNAARQEHNAAIASFIGAIGDWRASLTELRLLADDAFLTAVTQWCETPQFANPFGAAIHRALDEVTRDFAEQRAYFQQLEKTHTTELNRFTEERDRLASGEPIPMPRSHTRAARPRTGAPLWLLCDFVDDLDGTSRAAIEAALEAAGLLDAWVVPSGELLNPENHDAMLVAAISPLPHEEAHLGKLLVPSTASLDADCQIPSSLVADILRHIGAKPDLGHVWVSTDGQWQNGPVRGWWNKPAAQYIGQAAREMARRRRILELDSLIAEGQTCLDALIISVGELNWRDRAARSEADAAPVDEPVRTAYNDTLAAARELDSLRRHLAESDEDLARKRSSFDEATQERDEAVADLGIANWIDAVDVLESRISSYRLALSSLWPAIESFLDARVASQTAWACMQEAVSRERRQKDTADRAERAALAAEIAYDTLKDAFGADLGQTLRRVEDARRRLDGIRKEAAETRQLHHELELAVTRVDERLRNRTEILTGQTERRDRAASSLHSFACTRLLQLATPGIADEDAPTWSTTRTVEVAFELASRLDSIDATDRVWEHLQKSVPLQFSELMQTLSAQRWQSSATFRDDVFVATAMFAGRECTIEELRRALYDEVAAGQMLLDAREREILENHLVGQVASHLHELFSAVDEQVQKMNVELETCPMSTGMKLRFVWRAAEDGPSGLTEARRHLMQSNGTWSSGDCALLGSFLQQQIQAVCAQMEGGTWQECLAEALDYRKWHRFGVERHQDGVWKRLTRRTHGTGSGGEKAVALTLPHFAAAAAFYRTADRLAPRLILLDEAFVGIDADMRAKCMGLIHAFDLDFIMTSEREWGCYQLLPGLAIYQLSTRPGIDAIGLTRWVWTGQQRVLKQNLTSTENLASLVARAK